MRLSSFFRHCESDFFPNFFYCSSHQFLIFCNRMDVQKIPKRSPFYIFRHYATYRKLHKNFEKNSGIFFSIFSFLRAFVVSSCRKSDFHFRVFLSLRYGADLGRSRLVNLEANKFLLCFLPFYAKNSQLLKKTDGAGKQNLQCSVQKDIN